MGGGYFEYEFMYMQYLARNYFWDAEHVSHMIPDYNLLISAYYDKL